MKNFKRNKIIKHVVLLSIGFAISLALFQNCSRAPLRPIDKVVASFSFDMKPLSICSASTVDKSPPKYIFLVDMSASNLGATDTKPRPDPRYGSGVYNLSTWDSSKPKATDPEANRLKLIRSFLSASAAGASTSSSPVAGSSSFAIVPFSWDTKLGDPKISTAWSDSTKGFVAEAKAIETVDKLVQTQNGSTDPMTGVHTPGAKDFYDCLDPSTQSYSGKITSVPNPPLYYQDMDVADCDDRGYKIPYCIPALPDGTPGAPIYSCPYHMGETSYMRGLQAAQKIIDADIVGGSKTRSYYVFVISDGAPHDSEINENDKEQCTATNDADQLNCQQGKIFKQISFMQDTMAQANRNLYLYGLFYGGEAKGEAFMNNMVSYAKNGHAKNIDHFDSGTTTDFFNSVIPESTVYEPTGVKMLPLTTILKNGVVYADSDMDGIPDVEEAAIDGDPSTPGIQPLDPANPRSNKYKLLDGIYALLLKTNQLDTLKLVDGEENFSEDELRPDGTPKNYLGLTRRDMRALGIDIDVVTRKETPTFGKDLDGDGLTDFTFGLDSDGDGLIDFMEILKGLSPKALELTQDPDADGQITLQELLRGSDPFVPDTNLPANLINKFTVKPVPATECADGGSTAYSIKIDHLQNTKTLDISNAPNVPTYLRHNADEGIVYIGYQLVQNSTTLAKTKPTIYKGQYVRVKYRSDGAFEVLDENKPFVDFGVMP